MLGLRSISAAALAAALLNLNPVPYYGPTRRRLTRLSMRSKYWPHIGAKERARHAGKPDGPMHGLPPLFRANHEAAALPMAA